MKYKRALHMGSGAKGMTVHKRHATGYTLIELIAVLAIASALLIIAIPLFTVQIDNSRMSSAATDLLGTLMNAKSEAVGRNNPVTVCIRNQDADDCATTGQWEAGWLTFVDLNSNGKPDAGDEILHIHSPLADEITVRATGGTLENSITYRANGRTNLTGTEALVFCDGRDYSESSLALIVSIVGKASTLKAYEALNILEDDQASKGQCLRGGGESE